jgi:Peptidase A4 family
MITATLAAAALSALGIYAIPTASAAPASSGSAAPASGNPVHTYGRLRANPAIHLPTEHLPHPKAIRAGVAKSNNWSGYADAAVSGAEIYKVTGNFSVPSVNCANSVIGSEGSYADLWAGLDGLNDTTVEQEGMQIYCASTTSAPEYIAWYDMYPAAAVAYTGDIGPGDALILTTSYDASTKDYTLSLDDLTTGAGFTTAQPCPTGSVCNNKSAELITEAPGGGAANGYYLADYGDDTFSSARVTARDGLVGYLTSQSTYWTSDEIEMTGGVTGDVISVPGLLYGGSDFSTFWRGSD